MQTEKKRKFIIDCVYVLFIAVIIYVFFEYAIGFLFPFFIAYIISAIVRPLVSTIRKRIKISHKLASVIVIVFFYCTVGVLIFFIGAGIYSFAKTQIAAFPQFYKTKIEPVLSLILEEFGELPEDFDPTLAATLENIADNLIASLGSIVSSISGKLVSVVSSFASSVPTVVIGVIFSIISSFYFTVDHDKIYDFLKKQCSESFYEKITAVRGAIKDIIWSYVKSYTIILMITFAELFIALLILGVKNFPIVAFLIAAFDILPVVGTGTILIPWAAISFISKDYKMAIGLIITYVIVFIIRQVIEPKIVGHHVGLHPLVTIVAMFVGTLLFGVVGLFGIPICIAIAVDLNEKEVIHLFK